MILRFKLDTLKININIKKKKEKNLTEGIARAGAIGKSMGSVAASWKPNIRAKGFRFNFCATSVVVKIKAAAPSFNVDAFPAVTVPFSFYIKH